MKTIVYLCSMKLKGIFKTTTNIWLFFDALSFEEGDVITQDKRYGASFHVEEIGQYDLPQVGNRVHYLKCQVVVQTPEDLAPEDLMLGKEFSKVFAIIGEYDPM